MAPKGVEAGTVTEVKKESFEVACREGILSITEIQAEGKKRMSVRDFLLGYSLKAGTRLGQ